MMELFREMILIKEKSKVLWMYIDKEQFSRNAIKDMKKKYQIPELSDELDLYIKPINYNMTNNLERGDELVSSLNLSFGDD
mmetsp:Transcript_27371/g.24251  ORF Transcript_27371/g.24251 Transcript_27371/m.24251 type:complete len:81 (+) Transcript_27371:697-939(+)